MSKEDRSRQQNEEIAMLLRGIPDDYASCYDELAELTTAFKLAVAKKLEAPLRQHLTSMPHDTYAQKQTVASWVNRQLSRLNLAIRCPQTGNPAILVAHTGSKGSEPSSFRFFISPKDGRRRQMTPSRTLPELELMEAAPRRESMVRWADQIRDDAEPKKSDREI